MTEPVQHADYVCYGCGRGDAYVETFRTRKGAQMFLCWECFDHRRIIGHKAEAVALVAWDADRLTRHIDGEADRD